MVTFLLTATHVIALQQTLNPPSPQLYFFLCLVLIPPLFYYSHPQCTKLYNEDGRENIENTCQTYQEAVYRPIKNMLN